MNIFKNENNILNIIKFGSVIFTVVLSFLLTQVFIDKTEKEFKKDIQQLENEYIAYNKTIVKNLVNRIHDIIQIEKDNALIKLQTQLKVEVYKAHAIATAIYNKNKQKSNFSKEATFEEIKTSLGAIRYNENRSYIFIDDINGVKRLHPEKSFEGENILELKDPNGYQFVKKIVQTIKNKTESYDEYYWYKGTDRTQQYKKIGFYKTFEPYDISIGSAEYVKDFEDNLKKEILTKINALKFKKPTHLFVYDIEGLCLVNPKKELIGVNRYNVQRKDGAYTLRNILIFAEKNKEGFHRYKSSVVLDETLNSDDKISFIKLFSDWNWVIGSGFYLESLNKSIETKVIDLEKFNNETIQKILVISIVLTVLMISFSFYISNTVRQIFNDYKLNLDAEMRETLKREKLLVEQSKLVSMGEMIGNIAHQWRQPLSVISTGVTGMKMRKKYGSLDDVSFNDTCDVINDNAQYLSKTIDDFRNFIKGDRVKTVFSLKADIESFLHLVDGRIKNHNIDVILDLDENIQVNGYENELIQCFINIFNNARDAFVEQEGVRKFFFITTSIENNHAKISLKDNAGGVNKDIIGKVFEPYFTTKHKSQGTGLGLHMTYHLIVDGMKGTIEVKNVDYDYDSVQYRGAEFIISLPLN